MIEAESRGSGRRWKGIWHRDGGGTREENEMTQNRTCKKLNRIGGTVQGHHDDSTGRRNLTVHRAQCVVSRCRVGDGRPIDHFDNTRRQRKKSYILYDLEICSFEIQKEVDNIAGEGASPSNYRRTVLGVGVPGARRE
ncbi:7671_t:CDS:1 [Acaulospora colombiana]|uniref:7671_t:CDS:1 n=1 Tax=Acaulospora colombiana TaxID=27376 RepID=A0ACA9MSV5_9GLOM|nr:7671_t:CDS:1 [Acaulospora colombiana]